MLCSFFSLPRAPPKKTCQNRLSYRVFGPSMFYQSFSYMIWNSVGINLNTASLKFLHEPHTRWKRFVTSFKTRRYQNFENHISFCSQVDIGTLATIKSLATQGRHDAAEWVSSFVLSHSSVGSNFQFYAKVSNSPISWNCDYLTIIPLAILEYEARSAKLAIIISYPTSGSEINVLLKMPPRYVKN